MGRWGRCAKSMLIHSKTKGYTVKKLLLSFTTALVAASAIPAQAQVRITEVSAFSSGAVPANGYSSDWFELTNIGPVAVNITGWKMDDDSVSFASGAALTGVTNIAPGESVVFINTAVNAAFNTTWFSGSPPPSLQIGNYVGGPGLGQGGDTVAVFNSAAVLQARVDFGLSGGNLETAPFHTFDNAAGLNNSSAAPAILVTISTLSAVGINGAFASPGFDHAIGSPGTVGSVAAIPEPSSYALMLAGFAVIGAIARKRKQA